MATKMTAADKRHADALRYLRDKARLMEYGTAEDERVRLFLLTAIAEYTGKPEDEAALTKAMQESDRLQGRVGAV